MKIEIGQSFSPRQAMQLALKEAKKGLGWVEPNPPVGCVVLDSDYKFLSAGYHKKYGSDHAEVGALKKIGDKSLLKGAHVFVTLEPCHHTGKTPPCSLELAKYPIQSLTYGAEEPFTQKKGLDFLKEKGIKIIYNTDFPIEIESLIAPFKFSFLNKKSFVSLKVASSLDGVVALEDGESRWITGEPARDHVHFLRATHSAILVGVNTLLTDNPRLNIRVDPFKQKKNKVVILDPKGRSFSFLSKSRLLEVHSPEQIIICCANHLKNTKCLEGLTVFKSSMFEETGKKYFNLSELMAYLYEKEKIQSVLVEGGACCWSQFLRQQAAQKLYLYMAPKIIGSGLRWSKDFTIQKLSESRILNSITFQPIGDDFLIEGMFR